MRNLLLLIFFSSISLISLAQCAHNDHNEILYYNEPEILDINKQNILRNQSVWKEFLSNNGNWYVIFNERTGLPHRAFGQPIGLNNGIDDNASVLNFLNNSFDLPSDLRFSNKTINDKYLNINFSQYYRDLEILNSRVYAKLTLDKNIQYLIHSFLHEVLLLQYFFQKRPFQKLQHQVLTLAQIIIHPHNQYQGYLFQKEDIFYF